MCIINYDAEVSGTKIFVAPDSKNKNQITVYSNKVKTDINNMMILPVPNPNTVKFIDLTKYKNLFLDLSLSFHDPRILGNSQRSDSSHQSYIEVQSVGSYYASIIPSINHINLIDKTVFGVINPGIIQLLRKYYSKNYGFVICKLKSGVHEYHPFAYSHKIQDSGKLFVPTRHQHHGEQEENYSHWDHAIYSFNTGIYTELPQQPIKLKYHLIPFDFGTENTLTKCVISGLKLNKDIEFTLVN